MKPVIGITCNYDHRDAVGVVSHMGAETQDWQFLADDYVGYVEKAGGIPVLIPQCENPEIMPLYLERLDGLILSGGCDVDPARYGARVKAYCGTLFPRRDAAEIALIKAAYERKMPMLGICRGLQIMTVAFGGTLCQDIAKEKEGEEHFTIMYPRNCATHELTLNADSRIAKVFGKNIIGVNSFHHQCVKTVPDNAEATAESPDGIIEVLEFRGGHAFMLGVQWHPEMMYDSDEQRKLIDALVKAAGGGDPS